MSIWHGIRNVAIRVYRPKHLLSEDKQLLAADYEDIYAADKKARLMPQEQGWLDLGGEAIRETRATLLVPRSVDMDMGYIAEVKKLRTIAGVREVVSSVPSAIIAAAATSISLTSPARFEVGDMCTIVESSTKERFRVKSISGSTLTLYSDEALENAYTVAATITVVSLWVVESMVMPQEVGTLRQCNVKRLADWWT